MRLLVILENQTARHPCGGCNSLPGLSITLAIDSRRLNRRSRTGETKRQCRERASDPRQTIWTNRITLPRWRPFASGWR